MLVQAGKGEVAVAVGELMEAAGMADVLTLPKARVPVVKFVVPRTRTKVRAGHCQGGWVLPAACLTVDVTASSLAAFSGRECWGRYPGAV